MNIILSRNLRGEVIESLDEDSGPPKPIKQGSGFLSNAGSQKEHSDEPTLNSALVFCHLQFLRVSLSPDLHLSQV